MNNSLRALEKELRAFAKRTKNVKYSKAFLFSFLLKGVLSFSTTSTSGSVAEARRDIDSSIIGIKKLFKEAKQENNKLLKQSNLELIQLMEQGDHVVKSPWSSWQFGMNYFHNEWQGAYKGRGDKAEKYPYEGIFVRSDDPFERYVSPASDMYSLLPKSTTPNSASSNNRQGLSNSYGLGSTRSVSEPITSFEVSASINPRAFAAPTVTPLQANAPILPEAVNFVPAAPVIPSINPAPINVVTFDLDDYGNGGSRTMLEKETNIAAGTYTLTPTTPPFTPNFQGTNAVAEFTLVSSEHTADAGAIMNIDYTKKRAVTLDPINGSGRNGLKFTNYGTINLIAEQTGGIEVQPHNSTDTTTVLGINAGTINGNGDRQIAMIFTDEGASPGRSYTLQNDGQIILNGNQSAGYGLKIISGWVGHALNSASGTITINGDNSYGIGIGKSTTNVGAASTAKNQGTINVNGTDSGGIAAQVDMPGGIENTGTINVAGTNAFGMYSEISRELTNDGIINITGGTKNIGLRTGAANSLVNKKTITLSDGTENMGMYASVGTVKNDTGATIDVTGGENIGIVTNGSGTGINAGTVTVTGAGSTGLMSLGGTLNNTGTLTVNAGAGATRGAAGMVVTGGTLTNTGTATIAVTGDNSLGVYASGGTLNLGNTTVDATDGAVNFISDIGGTINFDTSTTATTGARALSFFNTGGTFNIATPLTVTVSGGSNTPATRGTAFLYQGTNRSSFSASDITNWAASTFGGTQSNLTLNMDPGSRLFIASDVAMNLSDTSGSSLASSVGANIVGTDYKSFMLYDSLLTINQSVNLDDPTDPYNSLEISNSSINNDNNNTVTGTQSGQTAVAQENLTTVRNKVTLNNNGVINLSGAQSTGMYSKFGVLNNNATGTITVGDQSTGLYGTQDTIFSNAGTITIGNGSTAIYSEGSTTQGVTNAGTINGGATSIGILYKPDASIPAGTIVSNTGNITLGDQSIGLYGESTSTGYILENTGNITVGAKGLGLYGYGANVSGGTITVGDGGVGVYSQGGNVNLTGGTIATGAGEAVGVYTLGSGQTITSSGTTFALGDTATAIANTGSGNTINSTVGTATLGNNNIYIYSNDATGTVNNSTSLTATGGGNYGIYSAGNVTNTGNMDFGSGTGNVGIYSIGGGTATNSGTITIGASDPANNIYGIGMAAGYQTTDTGNIRNIGTINVNGTSSIGMYGSGSGTTVTNDGTINLNADSTTGIYLDNGATGVNNGTITTGATGLNRVVGVYVTGGATLVNNGSVTIDAANGVGSYLKGGTVQNYGTMQATGAGAQNEYTFTVADTSKGIGGVEIDSKSVPPVVTRNGVVVEPSMVFTNMTEAPKTVAASSIGMYVDTSGISYTNPIGNVGLLTDSADLIIGTEAAAYTNNKDIIITDPNIIQPYYNSMLANPQVVNWSMYSGGLNWTATGTLDGNGYLTGIIMSKIPYTEWAGNEATPTDTKDTYNFLDGLEQRYGVDWYTDRGAREKELFNKLNSIGNNEEVLFNQAVDEMMGHQYANVQQRIYGTGRMLDKEITHLGKEWETKSKQSNKIKAFGMRDEYSTDTAGIIDYKSNAYGVAYLHEDETLKLGNSSGWYAGAVYNRIKFKDIGKSTEDTTLVKLGLFKSTAFDHNGSLKWTISGEGYVAQSNMHRKFLVVDDIFNAKSDYTSYGVALKNEISKEFRTSERTSIRPYGALKLEYGRFGTIKEDDGEVRLEVKGNDYYSIRPEVGVEFKYKQPMAVRTTFITTLGLGYENELGKVGDVGNKARVRYTEADWFGIRGEKDDRRGNFKADLNVGIENQRFGVTLNAGYDTKGENIRGGIGFRAIY